MSANPADALPPDLRAALLEEIDPGETLRWCDQPLASMIFRSALLPAAGIALLFGSMGVGMVALSLNTWRDLEASGLRRDAQGNGMGSVAMMLIVGSLVVFGSVIGAATPWRLRQRAARTVYALTDTRVFRLIRDRSGRVQMTVVEPGHPLSVSRREHRDGSGDILLYPSAANRQHAQLSLAATPRPREVERLIRTTFDPPTGRAGARA
jgi:hypothetical protein